MRRLPLHALTASVATSVLSVSAIAGMFHGRSWLFYRLDARLGLEKLAAAVAILIGFALTAEILAVVALLAARTDLRRRAFAGAAIWLCINVLLLVLTADALWQYYSAITARAVAG